MLGTGKDMWVSTNEAKDFKKVVAPGMLVVLSAGVTFGRKFYFL